MDHSGNSLRHGLPDDDREWTLDDREKRGAGSSEPTIPTKQCPECFFVSRPSPICSNCGFVYPVEGRTVDEVDGELQEVTERPMSIPQQVGIIARQDGLNGLLEFARQKGYKPQWAYHQMKVRGLPCV